jgi:hypothetical protein
MDGPEGLAITRIAQLACFSAAVETTFDVQLPE